MKPIPLILINTCAVCMASAIEPCRIEVVETASGWPVPLVELRTTYHARFFTGVIACDSPELMGRETWTDVLGNGYEMPKDGFGMRGVRLKPGPGRTLNNNHYFRGSATRPVRVSSSTSKLFISSMNFSTLPSSPVVLMKRAASKKPILVNGGAK